MALDDIPVLGSEDLDKILMEGIPSLGADPAEMHLLGDPAPWMLEPSPAGSAEDLAAGAALGFMPGVPPAGVPTTLPDGLPDFFLDPLMAEFVPLPSMGMDAFAPLPLAASSGDASASGSGNLGTSSSGGDSAGAVAAPAAAQARKARAAGGKKELTQEQVERIRAKNRRAQNRYREKQKAKAAEAEKDYHSTASELERMRLENLHLQEQNSTMQKVLAVREDAMDTLQKAAAEEGAPQKPALGDAGGAGKGGRPALTGGATVVQPGSEIVEVKEGGYHVDPANGELSGKGYEGTLEGSCPLTGLTISQIAELKKMPPEVLQQRWKSLAQRLEVILQQQDAALASPDPSLEGRTAQLAAQLKSTLQEGQAFCFEHAIYQPTSIQKLLAACLDDGRSHATAEDMGRWRAVAAAVAPSSAQVERLSSARANFLQRIEHVCGERRAIFERLAAVQVPTTLRELQATTATWLQVHEATAELSANMTEEHIACMSFVRDAFGYVLSPQQKARAIVASYPFFPDMYSIATAAMEAAGTVAAPPEPQLLAAPRVTTAAASVAVEVQ